MKMSFSKSLLSQTFSPIFQLLSDFHKAPFLPNSPIFALPYVKSKTPTQTSLYDRIT